MHERFSHSFSKLPQIRCFLRVFRDASINHCSVVHYAFKKSFQFFKIMRRIRSMSFNHDRKRTLINWRRQFQIFFQTDQTRIVNKLESGKNFAEIISCAREKASHIGESVDGKKSEIDGSRKRSAKNRRFCDYSKSPFRTDEMLLDVVASVVFAQRLEAINDCSVRQNSLNLVKPLQGRVTK